jgi:hypothetical protein
MHLLALVSGSAPPILHHIGLSAKDVHVVKVDEKIVAAPRQVFALVRKHQYASVIWGCKALRFQRFQPMMTFYALCSPAGCGIIIDEEGNHLRCSWGRFLLYDMPLLVAECCAAAVVAAVAFVRLPLLKKSIQRLSQHR